MADGLHAALREADRVAKKQKLCANKTLAGVDALLASVHAARSACISGSAGASSPSLPAACLAELHRQLLLSDVASQAAAYTKELHSAVTKLGKVRRAARVRPPRLGRVDEVRPGRECKGRVG